MNYKDYSTLKTANKVAFKEIAAVTEVKNDAGETTTFSQPSFTVLEKKVYNPNTGAESTIQDKMSLGELEREKTEKIAAKVVLETELTEIDKMITDIKAL